MPTFPEILKEACGNLVEILSQDPAAILNESELQALLQSALLDILPQRPQLILGAGLNDRRPGSSHTCRRVYRELKVSSGRSSGEADLIVLRDERQTLCPKANGAPARFSPPFMAIIETKIDASPGQIIRGHSGAKLAPSVFSRDREKWIGQGLSDHVVSLVYTSHPEWYEGLPGVAAIKRPVLARPMRPPCASDCERAASAYDSAANQLHAVYRENPFWLLREKDFETELFIRLRHAAGITAGVMNPVRTQRWSAATELLGRRRRHDLVVLSPDTNKLKLEVELKTSHSDSHNWFRKADVAAEYAAMQTLHQAGLLDRAVFALFRYGDVRWQNDAVALGAKYPSIGLDYRCSEGKYN